MRVPRAVAVLGEVLDLTLEGDGRRSTIRLKRPYWLCGEPGRERLWLYPAAKTKPQPLSDFGDELREAKKLYRRWHDLVPIGATDVRLRVGPPELVGRVKTIGYRSHKWSGKFDDWQHDFRRPPRLERAGEVYRISGGALRVTARGIEG